MDSQDLIERFLDNRVLELVKVSGVQIELISKVMRENIRLGMFLVNTGAMGAYDSKNDVIYLHDGILTSNRLTETILHELVHSTGHVSRLNRNTLSICDRPVTRQEYSTEEITAQLGMFKLAVTLGLDHDTHAQALTNYLPNYLIHGGDYMRGLEDSTQAVDFLLNQLEQSKRDSFRQAA